MKSYDASVCELLSALGQAMKTIPTFDATNHSVSTAAVNKIADSLVANVGKADSIMASVQADAKAFGCQSSTLSTKWSDPWLQVASCICLCCLVN